MNHAAREHKNVKDRVKPGAFYADAAEYRACSVGETAETQQQKSRLVYAPEPGYRAEKHRSTACKVYRHTDSFELFVIEEKELCYNTESGAEPARCENGITVKRADSVKGYQSARRRGACKKQGNCNVVKQAE